ncbi:pyridoxal phosphate-dependent aminotransferase [Aureimonas phyllosphaerae]|uniref:aspartate transaminase n=1 Tax=Aureimonas phyllosphaerae TaxID=1166078 RepID=A0A7W6FU26_9HYPH|nr:aminotransferase class I/II-fold pyridoxal phosphate-dependent enzyme [Aureimonas phyllosphaerae]MBB3935370.1 aspartate/methionine/tyrosine aminotransferase [Aureimonas phyllosphaerae]MBB3959378.1 aspartate/methionine/tyrosine aminotransferase [Aureimonas phyllosphaerae]SFF03895.1 Aspartate/methionine/tyrosine aminotransferase [Aureimonas phyllosphaerae]
MFDIPPPKASRRSDVDPFRAMDVMAAANRMIAEGRDVISLAVGQPSAPVPSVVAEAVGAFLARGRVGYTDALGRASLRRRIARHYADAYGVDVPAERVMVTTGSSAGFNLAFLTAFDVGDRVAISTPGYPAYRNILKALGIEPIEIPVGPDDDYILTAEALERAHREKPLTGVLIASPANPTGTVTPADELRRLVEFADAAGIVFVSDEIYHGLAFGRDTASALQFSDRAIIVNSFSKYYCMTGWRIGWLVLPPHLVRPAERVGQSLYISAPELSQVGAEAVFDATDELETVKLGYERSRALLMEALPTLGFGDIAPIDGAFYAYATIPEGFGDATELANHLLQSAHVAATPGLDFDLERGHRTMRMSYAGDPEEIAEAVRRLRNVPGLSA